MVALGIRLLQRYAGNLLSCIVFLKIKRIFVAFAGVFNGAFGRAGTWDILHDITASEANLVLPFLISSKTFASFNLGGFGLQTWGNFTMLMISIDSIYVSK